MVKRVGVILFMTVFLTCAYFGQGGGQNEAARFDTIRAWLEDGKLSVDQYAYNSADLILFEGKYYSSKAPGTFFVGAPDFAVYNWLLKLTPMSEPTRYEWVCYLTTVSTLNIAVAFLSVLIWIFSQKIGASKREGILLSLSIPLGTMIFPLATIYFSHALTATLVFFAFLQIFLLKSDSVSTENSFKKTSLRMILAGVAVGFSVSLEYPAVIAVALISVYALWVGLNLKVDRKSFLFYFAGLVISFIPLFIYNKAAFGKLWYVPYEAYASNTAQFFAAHRKGILGIRLPFIDSEFTPIFFSNLMNICFRPLRGLFYLMPVTIFLFPGFLLLSKPDWRRFRPESILALMMALGYITFVACFGDSIVYWGGGTSFGSRHLAILIPFLTLPFAAVLKQRHLKILFPFVVAISLLICLMATAIEPRTPYAPDNPVTQYYFPKFMKAEFAENQSGIFSNTPLVGNTVAFNFGKLLGLPGDFQLVFLYLIWILAAFCLDKAAVDGKRTFLYGISAVCAGLFFIQLIG